SLNIANAERISINPTNPNVMYALDNVKGGVIEETSDAWKNWKYTDLTGVDANIDLIKKTMMILLHSSIPCDFRLTYAKPLLNENDIQEVQSYLPQNCSLIIQNFIKERALNPTIFE
ncbi:MAG: anaerobic ribonucleoside-triphosphate reductase activating protein, partial [Candidatus Hydrogenedens sp.]